MLAAVTMSTILTCVKTQKSGHVTKNRQNKMKPQPFSLFLMILSIAFNIRALLTKYPKSEYVAKNLIIAIQDML